MKRLSIMLALAVLAPELLAKSAQYWVYVGTYTGAKSKGIYAFRFDSQNGQAGEPMLAAEVANPSFLALAPNGRTLCAVGELGSFQGKKTGAVSAFAINRATGQLTLLNQVPSGGPGPCHVTFDATGRWALVANYSGGSVASFPVRTDGSLGDAVSFHQHQGASVNPRRQEGPHAHGATLDPANRLLVVPDLGLDKLMLYDFDAATGKLTPHEPPFVSTQPGSGPRHFVFSPDGRHGYAINEMASTITAYAYNRKAGSFKELGTASTLPEDFRGESTTAEIEVHPTGKFVYGSNRGHDSIAVFARNGRLGTLKGLEHVPTQGAVPRSFAVDPSGKWLWVANQNSDNLVLFRIDPQQGTLQPTGTQVKVGAPVCVKYSPVE